MPREMSLVRRSGKLLFLLVLMVLPPGARAQAGFFLHENEVEAAFPDLITFHLAASVPDPVESAEFVYGIERVSCRDASTRAVPDMHAAPPGQVSLSWTWEFRRSGSVPPGARIWWQWHLVTDSGESWSTPVAWFTFDDDRHAWKTETQGDITVHWYRGDRQFGQSMLRAAVDAQARLTTDQGARLEEPVDLYFYADTDDLKASVQFAQSWTGGIAFPDYYTILIAAGPEQQAWGATTVAHELMHLVVRQLSFNCSADLPRWLDEGLATWAEGEADESYEHLLAAAIDQDELLSLRSLGGSFSAHSSRASLAYAQSYSVVTFLIDEYGRERILDLLAAFRQGATYDGALGQVYGLDTDSLEDLWRTEIGAPPRPTPAAPRASPSPVPTRALWSPSTATATPTPLPPTPTPSATPSATPSPAPTERPAPPTAVAREESPPTATLRPVARPTPIGGLVEAKPLAGWVWALAGAAGVAALVTGGVVLARRRGA